MAIDFNVVKAKHVNDACRKVITEGIPRGRQGRSTFIKYKSHLLPAKYVLGIAYKLATGEELSPDDYSGGLATAKVLEGVGFAVVHPDKKTVKTKGPWKKSISSPKSGLSVRKGSKKKLLETLRKRFGKVQVEVAFPWLTVPDLKNLPPAINRIRKALVRYRGHTDFDTPGFKLKCDFYLPDRKLIIEIDERQHFTEARAVALQNYPARTRLGFSADEWIKNCHRIAAVDPTPPYRDEQRAYYDSLRDLLAAENDMAPVMRVMADDIEAEGGPDRLVEKIADRGDPVPIVRIVVKHGKGPGDDPIAAERVFLDVLGKQWPGKTRARFLLTPGGFLKFKEEGAWDGSRGWESTKSDVTPFIKKAEGVLLKALSPAVLKAAQGKVDFLSIGIDGGYENRINAELVALVEVRTGKIINWTGKSFPTADQERRLVQVVDLSTHFKVVGQDRVMILGCHDLSMFSPRGNANQNKGGHRWHRCREMWKRAMEFKPTIVLQHPHATDTPKTWTQSWNTVQRRIPSIIAWASGVRHANPGKGKKQRCSMQDVLDGTRSSPDSVVDIING